MELSVMFFSGSVATGDDAAAYRLVLDVARYADRAGFASVWLPERHFTALGSPYPNPALLHAAVAGVTERIGLRAGSVVLPLHDPLRVAEDWAIVDVLSGGRVGISLASGWHADDFALRPERYHERDAVLDAGIPVLQRLWRGEEVEVLGGEGRTVAVRTFPRPLQASLPLWVTAARREETFDKAGRLGLNLLTHLLDQDLDRLGGSVARYRKARADAGWDPATGTVTVMVHTYVGEDAEVARAQARAPYCASLRSNLGLLGGLARSRGRDVDLSRLGDEELDEFTGFLYDRFVSERAFIGSPGTCVGVAREFAEIGVDEVACLLDFGPPAEAVLGGLPHLERLRDMVAAETAGSPAHTLQAPPEGLPAVITPEASWTSMTGTELYDHFERQGAAYGPALRCVESVRVAGDTVEGVLDLPVAVSGDFDDYTLHPALLDNAVLLLGLLAAGAGEGGGALPVGLRRLRTLAPLQRRVHVRVHRRRESERAGEVVGDVTLRDPSGRLLVEAEGVRLRQLTGGQVTGERAGREYTPCYRLEWVEAGGRGTRGGTCDRWLVVGGPGTSGGALREAVQARGVPTSLLECDGLGRADLEEALAKCLSVAAPGEVLGIACTWPLDVRVEAGASGEEMLAAVERCLHPLLEVVQWLAGHTADVRARLWVVTRGAQCVTGADAEPGGDASGVAQSPLWGVCRVLPHEHEDLWGGILDVDPSWDVRRVASAVGAALVAATVEDQVALRGERVLVPRLVRAPEVDQGPDGPGPGPELDRDVTYLLTGGLGDIGLALARRMVQWGARNFLLASRHELGAGRDPEGERAGVEALRRAGARVAVRPVDVTDGAQVERLATLASEASLPRLGGVVHLAGTSDGALLATLDRDRLRRVLAPKVAGAWNLHRTLGGAGGSPPLVLVSAIPSLVGPIGVGAANYAGANAFLDTLGGWRAQRSLPGVVVACGPWAEIGMAARHGDGLDLLSRYGVSGLDPATALSLFGAAWRAGAGMVAIADVDWAELAASFPALTRVGQFEALSGPGPAARQRAVTAAGQELLGLAGPERRATLHALVSTRLAAVLGMDPAELATDRPVTELGLDSLMALELRNRLEAYLGVRIPMVELLEGPTVETLVASASSLLQQAGRDSATEHQAEIEEFVL